MCPGAGARASAFFISDLVGEFLPDVRPDAFCTLQSVALTKIFARKISDFLDRTSARRAPATFWSFCQVFSVEIFIQCKKKKKKRSSPLIILPFFALVNHYFVKIFSNFQKIFSRSFSVPPKKGFVKRKTQQKRRKSASVYRKIAIFTTKISIFYEKYGKITTKILLTTDRSYASENIF